MWFLWVVWVVWEKGRAAAAQSVGFYTLDQAGRYQVMEQDIIRRLEEKRETIATREDGAGCMRTVPICGMVTALLRGQAPGLLGG